VKSNKINKPKSQANLLIPNFLSATRHYIQRREMSGCVSWLVGRSQSQEREARLRLRLRFVTPYRQRVFRTYSKKNRIKPRRSIIHQDAQKEKGKKEKRAKSLIAGCTICMCSPYRSTPAHVNKRTGRRRCTGASFHHSAEVVSPVIDEKIEGYLITEQYRIDEIARI
ncbi:hypothetical protein DBV15_04109, partial [Temnothorax longispinosus]